MADDEGQTIKVRVVVTDDAGNETTLTSAATEAVEAPEPPVQAHGPVRPAVSHDGVTLGLGRVGPAGQTGDDHIAGATSICAARPGDPSHRDLRHHRRRHRLGADRTPTKRSEPDKEYVYRIKAINERGEESEVISHWIRADTPAVPEPPDKPTGLSATVVSRHR